MARGLAEINWEDVTDYVPAVVTALANAFDVLDRNRHRYRLHHLRSRKSLERTFPRSESSNPNSCRRIRFEIQFFVENLQPIIGVTIFYKST